MYTLFAYDPGGTTGWAQFLVRPELKLADFLQCGEHDLWCGIEEQLYPKDYIDYDTVVAYENIVPRHMDFNPVGLQVIGVIRFLCEKRGIPITKQPNALIHGIERWGLYDLSEIKSPHARDATMHGIVYLRKLGIEVQV